MRQPSPLKPMNRLSSSSKCSTHHLPQLIQDEVSFHMPPLPRKYKRIPRRIQHQQIRFNFNGASMKNYRFKSSQNIHEYKSQYKIGGSLHEKSYHSSQHQKEPPLFSSKKNIIENQSSPFRNVEDNMGKATFYRAYTHKLRTEDFGGEKSLISTILDDLDKYALIPKGIESLRQSQHKRIEFKRQALNNNNRLKLIGNTMEKSGKYEKVDLSNNLMNQDSSKMIIEKMIGVEDINLAGNEIGERGTASLNILCLNPHCNIKTLNISNNSLADNLLARLIKSMNKLPLNSLDISQNHANRKTCLQLKTLLKANNLVDLNLGWNKIDSISAFHIIQALRVNSSVKHLNLSWNSIGNSEKLKDAICKMIKKNQELIHLDFSYCLFTKEQYQSISSALNFNRTLIGLHCEGSCAFLDCRGHLNVTSLNKTVYESEAISKQFSKKFHLNVPTCWMCQGWREFRFEEKFEDETQHFIHFSFQNYQKTLLEQDGRVFSMNRYVPPVEFSFFISYQKGGQPMIKTSDKYSKTKKKIFYQALILDEINVYLETRSVNYKNLISSALPRALPVIQQQSSRDALCNY